MAAPKNTRRKAAPQHYPEVLGGDYLSAQQLAEDLGINTRTLVRWRKLRKSPPFTILGRQVYYRRAAFNEWMLAREGASRSDLKPRIELIPRQRNARQRNARRAAR